MNKDTARKIADALTWARVVSVVPITKLAWYELRWWVFALYVLIIGTVSKTQTAWAIASSVKS